MVGHSRHLFVDRKVVLLGLHGWGHWHGGSWSFRLARVRRWRLFNGSFSLLHRLSLLLYLLFSRLIVTKVRHKSRPFRLLRLDLVDDIRFLPLLLASLSHWLHRLNFLLLLNIPWLLLLDNSHPFDFIRCLRHINLDPALHKLLLVRLVNSITNER